MVAKRLRWVFAVCSISIVELSGSIGQARAGLIASNREPADCRLLGARLAGDLVEFAAPIVMESRVSMRNLLDPIDLTRLPVDPWLDANREFEEIGSNAGENRWPGTSSAQGRVPSWSGDRVVSLSSETGSPAADETGSGLIPRAIAPYLVFCLLGLLGVFGSDCVTRRIRRFVRAVNRGRRRPIYRYFY